MRRTFLVIICLVLITLGLPTNSFATSEGCPDTWVIDTTQYPNNELRMAKAKLGPQMIMTTTGIEITDFMGENGPSPKIENLGGLIFEDGRFNDIFWRSLLLLYSKSRVKFTMKVEIQGCKNPGFFTFSQNVPTGGDGGDVTNSVLKITRIDSKTWASRNIQFFEDFKAAENFAANLSALSLEKLKNAKNISPYKPTDNFVTPHLIAPPSSQQIGLKFSVVRLVPQLLTPECLLMSLDQKNVNQPVIRTNMECKYSWSVDIFKQNLINELVVFDEVYSITYASRVQTITCVKGKTTKKVSGINPQCPKGYKKAA